MSASFNKLVQDNNVEFVDLRFADMLGKQHHVTFPVKAVDDSLFEDGKMFDGSSISGWKGINDSDMVLMPDPDSAILDPFAEIPTVILTCDVLEPSTMQAYTRCPRSVAKRAESFLKSSGVADTAFFGPEPEFFIFDSVRYKNDMQGASFEIQSEEAAWSTNDKFDGSNSGHRPSVKGGYFPVAPVDSLQDLRSEMCKILETCGLIVEVHHHEVATAGQCEIGTKFNTLTKKADELLTLKYVIKNVAHRNGKTATFLPKPIVGDNGSGMHVHQSLAKGGTNLFAGDLYGGLSQTALYYIGGIFKHERDQRVRQLDDEQLQASRAGLRSAGDARVLGAQPLGELPHSVRALAQGAPHRSALPRSGQLRLPHVHRADDGRPRRHFEQDRSGCPERQGSLRPAAGRREEHPDRLPFARSGARSARQGSRVPESRRRVLRRSHRRLHRSEAPGSHALSRGDASARVPDVLRDLTATPQFPLSRLRERVEVRATKLQTRHANTKS